MTIRELNDKQLQKMKTQPGFIAALDQSGGSCCEAANPLSLSRTASVLEEILQDLDQVLIMTVNPGLGH